MRAERGSLKVGGDSSGGGLHGSPPVEETVSLFSGIVAADADGKAQVTFALPDFNGTVRVMAVAWSADKLGHAAKDVIVRDPIALTASGPRFLTLGDKARLKLDIHNVEGPATEYKLSVQRTYQAGSPETAGASAEVSRSPYCSPTVRAVPKRWRFLPRSSAWSPTMCASRAWRHRRETRSLVRRQGASARCSTRYGDSLPAGGGKVTLSNDLLNDLIPSRARVNLSVGPLSQINVPSLLNQLEHYPYGCAEQTTSRALPLLYSSELSVQASKIADASVKSRIDKAIAHLFSMQDSSGAFGVWGPNNGDMWLTAYVTDFLSRARSARYAVDQRKFTQALDRLQNFVSYVSDFKAGGESRAYALYVLARNARAPIGELRYYVDTRLDRFATPLAKAQLGAALAMMGDKARAETAFKSAARDLGELSATGSRRDYGSEVRDGAAVLTLASESRMLRTAGIDLSRTYWHARFRRVPIRRPRSRPGCCLQHTRSKIVAVICNWPSMAKPTEERCAER